MKAIKILEDLQKPADIVCVGRGGLFRSASRGSFYHPWRSLVQVLRGTSRIEQSALCVLAAASAASLVE